MKVMNYLIIILSTLFFAACTVVPVTHIPDAKPCESTTAHKTCEKPPQKIVVFFDGTNNDEGSYTNVFKLRNLLTLQDRRDIRSVYIAGVGTGYRIIGAGTGWGTGDDVRNAYKFLTQNYKSVTKDEIYLFGFSRGSWSARILAGLVQVAGIPDLSGYSESFSDQLVDDIYAAYKGKLSLIERREAVQKVLARRLKGYQLASVNIKFTGLWDTVEALGWPDLNERNEGPNRRYIEQLCNVEQIAHALSVDDDRARIFTPILLTKAETRNQCGYYQPSDSALAADFNLEILGKIHSGDINDGGRNIKQVFFPGAHSDVGGGYLDTDIDGVSLNWMIAQLKGHALLPDNTRVYADPFGRTHNPEQGFAGLLYHRMNRNLSLYYALLDEQLTVHQAVIDRLQCVPVAWYEYQWQNGNNLFRHCFTKDGNLLKFNQYHPQCHLLTTSETGYEKPACRFFPLVDSTMPAARSKAVEINAKQKKAHTGILLSKDKRYRFSISDVKCWNDHGLKANPYSGRGIFNASCSTEPDCSIDEECEPSSWQGKLLTAAAKPFTHAPKAGYMELLGSISSKSYKHNQTFKPVRPAQKSTESKLFRLGQKANSGKCFTPPQDGELIVFVNEPIVGDLFYDNNNGTLQLTVEILKPEDCPSKAVVES